MLAIRFMLLLIVTLIIATLCVSQVHAQKNAEEAFENVKVLKDMPADQMGKVMNIMSQSLGVSCNHCHEGNDFAREQVGAKDKAREMIRMTRQLNSQYFAGSSRVQVTCYTCHRGQTHPLTSQVTDGRGSLPNELADQLPLPEPITVEEVLSKFKRAIGQADTVAQTKSLHFKAERIEPDGKREPEEYWWSATGTSRLDTTYGQFVISERFDGQAASKFAGDRTIELKPDEAAQIRTESLLMLGMRVPEAVSKLRVLGRLQLDGQAVIALEGFNSAGNRERLYFDDATGLLLQRQSIFETWLGPHVYTVAYRDYQLHDGLKLPMRISYSMPAIRWERQVQSVGRNEANR